MKKSLLVCFGLILTISLSQAQPPKKEAEVPISMKDRQKSEKQLQDDYTKSLIVPGKRLTSVQKKNIEDKLQEDKSDLEKSYNGKLFKDNLIIDNVVFCKFGPSKDTIKNNCWRIETSLGGEYNQIYIYTLDKMFAEGLKKGDKIEILYRYKYKSLNVGDYWKE